MGRVYCDLATARYGLEGHPEAPFRVLKTHDRLVAAGHSPEMPPVRATKDDVSLLHAPEHFARVAEGDFHDMDTPAYPGIAETALISLSGALSAAASAAGGEPAFSLMRPPGHHAGRDSVRGFCYFNNLALACERLKRDGGAARVAVLDVDVHHGDGTEELLMGREGYLFCSLHQSPLYPGTGLSSRGNCANFPIPPGTGEGPYLKVLEKVLTGLVDFKPDLLAVSAGFDTYKDCPIAQLRLEKETYRKMGRLIAQTGLKRFAALEGGYAEDLPVLIERFLDGFFG